VVTSVKTYDMLNGKLELHRLDEGLMAVREGWQRPLAEVMRVLRQGIADDTI